MEYCRKEYTLSVTVLDICGPFTGCGTWRSELATITTVMLHRARSRTCEPRSAHNKHKSHSCALEASMNICTGVLYPVWFSSALHLCGAVENPMLDQSHSAKRPTSDNGKPYCPFGTAAPCQGGISELASIWNIVDSIMCRKSCSLSPLIKCSD